MRRFVVASLAFLIAGQIVVAAGPDRSDRSKGRNRGPFVNRLIRGSGIGLDKSGRPTEVGRQELEFYSRFLAVNPHSDPPTAGVRLRLDYSARAAIERKGIKTYGALPGFASAIIPIHRLKEVTDLDGIEMMRIVPKPEKELDASVLNIGVNLVRSNYDLLGEGIIVGTVDSGVDWTHDDFRNDDGSTRLLYIWNQDDSCVGTPPPPPFDFGCLFTEADINDALGGGPTIDAPNGDGHGSHALGASGGDGSATGHGYPSGRYVGVAPKADLIMVKTFPESGSCSTCYQIGLGLEFIATQAAAHGQPWAANLSLGSSFGGHDGSDIDEMTIDTLTGPGIPGAVITKSAGNYRGYGIHASGTVGVGTTNSHTFTIPNYAPPAPGYFTDVQAWSLWYEGGDELTVCIKDPSSGPCGMSVETLCNSTGDGGWALETDSGRLLIDDSTSPAPNGARFFDMEVDDVEMVGPNPTEGPAPCPGEWTVEVTGDTITEGGRYDMWIWYSSFGVSEYYSDWTVPDFEQLISVPGTAFNVTTVGAYVTKIQWTREGGGIVGYNPAPTFLDMAPFSSPGPTRDGRLKPEITAPGMGVASVLSNDVASPFANRIVEDGVHYVMEGTSFSAPHAAGVYALMLELNPDLDAVQLRTILTSTAHTDTKTEKNPDTGAPLPTPNIHWGYGKIDALAAVETVIKDIPDLMMTDPSSATWTGIATADTYNVYRKSFPPMFDGTFYGNCLQSGLATPAFTDTDIPAAGTGFAYYVTGVQDGIEGLLGRMSDGTMRPNVSSCP